MEFLSAMLKDGIFTAVVTGETNKQVEFECDDFESGISQAVEQLFKYELKVGDRVKVLDSNWCYPRYEDWFKETNNTSYSTHFVFNKLPDIGKSYNLVAIAPHRNYSDGDVYVIQDPDTTQVFLMKKESIIKEKN